MVGGQTADNCVEIADSRMEKYCCLVGGQTSDNHVETADNYCWRNIAVWLEV